MNCELNRDIEKTMIGRAWLVSTIYCNDGKRFETIAVAAHAKRPGEFDPALANWIAPACELYSATEKEARAAHNKVCRELLHGMRFNRNPDHRRLYPL